MGAACCPPNKDEDISLAPRDRNKALLNETITGDTSVIQTHGSPIINREKKVGLDDFKIEKVIGRGSFGKVYMVTKKQTGEIFAMKVLKKQGIKVKKQKIHLQAERNILASVESAFIVHLHYAFQTEEKLYFVVDMLNGGELFYHLRKQVRFQESRTRFYAAEITLALQALHKSKIIYRQDEIVEIQYRDLKPENVLLDPQGHIRLTDFGLSKLFPQYNSGPEKAYTFCGTPQYLAPEVIRQKGHDKAVDWWSLGALTFEMLSGRPPFWNRNRQKILRDILEKKAEMKPYFSDEAKDLLTRLLQNNPAHRLGSGPSDATQIKRHPFFNGIDWERLEKKAVPAPFRPHISGASDLRNIDAIFKNERPKQTPTDSKWKPAHGTLHKFQDFTYRKQDHVSKL